MKINKILLTLILFLIVHGFLSAQSKTNTQLVDSLIYLSVDKIVEQLKNEERLQLNFIAADDYSILKSKVILFLQKKSFEIVENNNNSKILNYNLDDVKIMYKNVFRDGLFGSYLVGRTADISGLFNINVDGSVGKTTKFNYSLVDTVLYNDLSKLENIAYSFTSAEIPDEPFFSSTLEPAIAVGTAAVAIYLFFNIRSK